MPLIILDSNNIADYPWIWAFFEAQRLKNRDTWKTKTTYKYNNQKFQFKEPVFARERKNGGFAYEMVSSTVLGKGYHGSVRKISRTLSMGKHGVAFQAVDKNRVVKIQSKWEANTEYARSHDIRHLHLKKPVRGKMVMRNLGEQTLKGFLRDNNLTREEKLIFTRELLRTFKAQILDLNLSHRDLNRGNILITTYQEEAGKRFVINMIDYSFRSNWFSESYNKDFIKYILPCIRELWSMPGCPLAISHLLEKSIRANEYLDCFEHLTQSPCLSPTIDTQHQLDNLFFFLDKLNNENAELSNALRAQVLEALQQSTADDLSPLRAVVRHCRESYDAAKIDGLHFPFLLFSDEGNEKQQFLDQIDKNYRQLEEKAQSLLQTPMHEEGRELANVVATLRERTLEAVYHPQGLKIENLKECRELCANTLTEKKQILDIHRNYNYIWAEIAVVFSSLIVLYPVVMGLNYLATGRLGFFGETRSAACPKNIDDQFQELETRTMVAGA